VSASAAHLETEGLWHDLHERLRAYVARRVRSRDDVDDILQDVFLRIHDRLETLADSDRVVAWIFRIAANAVTDHYRAGAKRAASLPDDPPSRDDAAVDAAVEHELARCMEPLIDRLPEKYRAALTLTELEQVDRAEAAERLGLSVRGLNSRVQRGRAMIKAMLLDCCHIELDARRGVVDYRRRPGGRSCSPDCG
jgi:RNA polymerase sigma-70 factor (ECF subfamily)